MCWDSVTYSESNMADVAYNSAPTVSSVSDGEMSAPYAYGAYSDTVPPAPGYEQNPSSSPKTGRATSFPDRNRLGYLGNAQVRDYLGHHLNSTSEKPAIRKMVSRLDAPGSLSPVKRNRGATTRISTSTIKGKLFKQKGGQWIKRIFCIERGNLCQVSDAGIRRHFIPLSSNVVVKQKGKLLFKVKLETFDFCRLFKAKTADDVLKWLNVFEEHGCTVSRTMSP